MSKDYTNTGEVLEIGDLEDFGKYTKQTVLFLETCDDYPQLQAVDFWNEKLEEVDKIKVGDTCDYDFNIKSKKWQDKLFTNMSGRKIFSVVSKGKPAATRQMADTGSVRTVRSPGSTPAPVSLPVPNHKRDWEGNDALDEDVPF